jgi:hypothetical protein
MDATTILAPINLPSAVFIHGGAHQSDLAQALTNRNRDYGTWDFRKPLFDSISTLFWADFGYINEYNIDQKIPLQGPSVSTAIDLYSALDNQLSISLGEDYLSRCYINWEQNGAADHSNMIFTNVDVRKAKPLFDFFGPKDCLVLCCGSLTKLDTPEGVKTLWLPKPSLIESIADIIREQGLVE